MTRELKVSEFREAAGKTTYEHDEGDNLSAVMSCLFEELDEFADAVEDYDMAPCEATREQLCKEWADLQYVVSQAAVYFEIPASAAFNRVHQSNMSKVVDGKIILREDGKILKPDTYVAPNMKGL